jgi:tetratricopeptide (TPR) repeat protein
MGKLADTYLKYGVPSDLALKYEAAGLSVTTFRNTPVRNLVDKYNLESDEATWVIRCLVRQPIDSKIVQRLLENTNFVCCCCKGVKSDHYIIHHIEPYEVSQDNSYENVAVLCPSDHDLAHSQGKLTNILTPDQIKYAKNNWEGQVRIHNIALSRGEQKAEILSKLPRYISLERELDELRERLNDKQKIIARSEAFFTTQMAELSHRINAITSQKNLLEQQVSDLASRLANMDLTHSSVICLKARELFFKGNINAAIEVLSEADLELEKSQIEDKKGEIADAFAQNAESWLLRGRLLTIERDTEAAIKSARKAIEASEQSFALKPETHSLALLSTLEAVGSIFYNLEQYEEALHLFQQGFYLCMDMREQGDVAHLPLLAIIMQNIGACYYSIGTPEESVQFLEEADALLDGINKAHNKLNRFDNTYFEVMHLLVLTNLGTSYKALGRKDNAIKAYLRGRDISSGLHIVADSTLCLQAITMHLSGLATFYFYERDHQSAESVFAELLPFARRLLEETGDQFICLIADILRDGCACYFFQQNISMARPLCEEALELFRKMGSNVSAEVATHLVDTLVYKILMILQDQGYSSEIEELAAEALKICEKHLENTDAQHYPATISALLAKARAEKNKIRS